MYWARWIASNRTIGIVALVAGLHAVALNWALSFKIAPSVTSIPESLVIEFAETAPPPEARRDEQHPPDPIPEPRPALSPPNTDIAPAPERVSDTPEPSNQAPLLESSPSVLTQDAPGDDASPASAETGAGDTVSEAQIATVLNLLDCQKLRDHHRDDCSGADHMTAAAAAAERDTVAPRPWGATTYINKTVMEQVLDREAEARLNWPDADLFAEPMPAGAYNAQRIRDAREPLWSKEMRDGFRGDGADAD